ncbi:MAG: ATP-binding protein [Candidatus Krumholzibacteriia bacterium]
MATQTPLTRSFAVLSVDADLCVNCQRCLTACPVKYCNDASGDHVAVDHELCIGCGACLSACTHGARVVDDALPRVLADLEQGVPYCAIVAPSAAAAFGDQLLNLNGWLRSLGVSACFDVSFGAELAVRSYLDHLDHDQPECIIAQPCPVVVTYIELYRPELLRHLAPVHSPMAHTVRMIAADWPEYRGHRLLAISPCAAKARELAGLDPPVANVTIEAVERHLKARGHSLADFPAMAFTGPPAERAVGFSSPGGLLQTLVRERPALAGLTRTIEGPEVFPYLDDLAAAIAAGQAPRVVDVLNCSLGCNGGTASGRRGQVHRDRLEFPVRRRRDQAMADQAPADLSVAVADHWRRDRYRRDYVDRTDVSAVTEAPTEAELQAALAALGKRSSDDELNCASCGYGTCRGMARAIALGLNRPENCLFYLREELAAGVFETLHSGLAIIDAETHLIERVNPVLAELLGAPAADLVGRSCHEVICSSARGVCPITDLGLDVDADECTLTDAQGRRIPVLKTVARFESHGRPLLIENVTSLVERKQLEDELAARAAQARELAATAQRASAAKSAFLANMSHEIRTPMNGILGVLQLLRDTEMSDEQRQYLQTMSVCGDQLLTLIADVIDLSRIEAGRVDLEVADLDPRAVVGEALAVVEARAAGRNLALSSHVSPEVPGCVRGDAGRLRQVLINLLGNAVKFTEAGSVAVHLAVETSDDRTVTLRAEVRDTGIGIALADQVAIFETFSQADISATRRFEGSGLGLAICRQLIELMSGTIGVDSEPGRGSTFWFTAVLGRADGTGPLMVSPRSTAGEAVLPPGLRALVVEDNHVNQMVAVRLLSRGLGIEAMAVDNGAEAVAILQREDFDVVFMDCHMPVLDGYAATRKIRGPDSGVRRPDVPIIAMTANAVAGARDECLLAGMDDYLSKPINAGELRTVLARVLAAATVGSRT